MYEKDCDCAKDIFIFLKTHSRRNNKFLQIVFFLIKIIKLPNKQNPTKMFQLNKISNSKSYSSSWTSSHLFLLLRIFLLGVTPVVQCAKFHSGSQERQAQRFAMEPQDQTAIVGSRATLPCRVIDKAGRIQWTKDDFGLGVHRNLSGYDRYAMVGSDEEGDFSLDVSPVMLDDDAKYQCQVSPGPDGKYR